MKYKEIVIGMKVTAKTKHDTINAVVLGFKPNSYTKVELKEIGEESNPKRTKHGYQRGTFEAGDLYTIHIDDIQPLSLISSKLRTAEEQAELEKLPHDSQHNSPIAFDINLKDYGSRN